MLGSGFAMGSPADPPSEETSVCTEDAEALDDTINVLKVELPLMLR